MAFQYHLYEQIDDEKISLIEGRISWHGLDKYFDELAEEDFQGTVLEDPLSKYLQAREALLERMKELNIEF